MSFSRIEAIRATTPRRRDEAAEASSTRRVGPEQALPICRIPNCLLPALLFRKTYICVLRPRGQRLGLSR